MEDTKSIAKEKRTDEREQDRLTRAKGILVEQETTESPKKKKQGYEGCRKGKVLRRDSC